MTGDVLRRNAARALRDGIVVALLFCGRKLVFGMCVQESTVAAEREHEQRFSVESRRGRARLSQRGQSAVQSIAQKHASPYHGLAEVLPPAAGKGRAFAVVIQKEPISPVGDDFANPVYLHTGNVRRDLCLFRGGKNQFVLFTTMQGKFESIW